MLCLTCIRELLRYGLFFVFHFFGWGCSTSFVCSFYFFVFQFALVLICFFNWRIYSRLSYKGRSDVFFLLLHSCCVFRLCFSFLFFLAFSFLLYTLYIRDGELILHYWVMDSDDFRKKKL
ncbi:hypothetical protein BZA05DRAFT_383752 [Tricharina praecox]|uniref:uncharacterized protein n=1 Tax=Tricharina praecox TaxID=43433 RepID=UPI00221FAB57|nr:uncharacterized protein BZA05DRAFT_383752 [Tricharina praecox]KAI5857500.1 hypothetical protein BZA05DRAFT_383752 [Tricharina praecox]